MRNGASAAPAGTSLVAPPPCGTAAEPGSLVSLLSFFSSASAGFFAPSSSLSFASGDGRSLRKTVRYTLRVSRMSWPDCANQSSTGPAFVEPKKYRYFPLRSNTGSVTSARPSVIGNDLFCSTEYTETVITSGSVPIVYASHFESGDHACRTSGAGV